MPNSDLTITNVLRTEYHNSSPYNTQQTNQPNASLIIGAILPASNPNLFLTQNFTNHFNNIVPNNADDINSYNRQLQSHREIINGTEIERAIRAIVVEYLRDTAPIEQHDRVRHGHRTDEALHSSEQQSWQHIFERLQHNTLSVDSFYGHGAGRNRHYEMTIDDEAHTDVARQAATEAAEVLRPYLPTDKAVVVRAIQSLIDQVKRIQDGGLRRKVKFAVDRLLRDNENDVVTGLRGRQLLIASYLYLQRLEGGPNSAELHTFWLGLSAYIDSEDYPSAPTGDVSTGRNFSIGVFAGDEEVRSDAGLDPACYGRMRNISSSMLTIYHAVRTNQRMILVPETTPLSEGKVIGDKRIGWTNQAILTLRFLKDRVSILSALQAQKLLAAFTEGGIKATDQVEFVTWFQTNGLPRDIGWLQTALSIIADLENMRSQKEQYLDNAKHQVFFNSIEEGIQLLLDVKKNITEQLGHDVTMAVR